MLIPLYLFFLAFLVYPLLWVFVQAFFVDGNFSLVYFNLLLNSGLHREMVGNSLLLAISTTVLSSLIAVPFALLSQFRTFRGRAAFSALIALPLLLPPFVGALGLQKFLGRFGIVNLLLAKLGLNGMHDWLGNSGFFGVVLLQTLHLFPLIVFTFRASLNQLDSAAIEAAKMVGARSGRIFWKVILPSCLPGYFAGATLVAIGSLTDLGTPLMLNFRNCVSVQIFRSLSEVSSNPSGAALVVLLSLVSVVLFVLANQRVSTLELDSGGRTALSSAAKPLPPAMEKLVFTLCFILLLLALLPHVGVFLISISDGWHMTLLPKRFTLANYGKVFFHPLTLGSMANSLVLSFATVILCVGLGFLLSYFSSRTSYRGTKFLMKVAHLPLAIPGIVFAFGYATSYSGTFLDNRIHPFPLLILAYTVRRLPLILRTAEAGFSQASPSLEEAGYMVGAGKLRTLRRVTLPIIRPHLVAGGLLCFAFAMLEVSDSMILALEDQHFPISKALFALSLRPDGVEIASALGILVMIFTSVLSLLGQRWFSK